MQIFIAFVQKLNFAFSDMQRSGEYNELINIYKNTSFNYSAFTKREG